jgi:hypothetical protein
MDILSLNFLIYNSIVIVLSEFFVAVIAYEGCASLRVILLLLPPSDHQPAEGSEEKKDDCRGNQDCR